MSPAGRPATVEASPSDPPGPAERVLEVEDLRVTFTSRRTRTPAVTGVSFSVEAGRTLGIVGESGSGKSVTARALMGLLSGRFEVSGSARLRGRELIGLPEREMRRHRGSDIAMVFQDPMRALNPTMRVGTQIAEAVRLHRQTSRDEAWNEAVSLLGAVRVSDPEQRARAYPHQMSGGMRQRAMIAMALSARPAVLIADEPTTALDVTTQAQILALLDDLKSRFGMGVILITHDMSVAAHHTDRLAVMYAGRIVETGRTAALFERIRMPYSDALLQAIPTLDQESHSLLASIEGSPPDLTQPSSGCAFAPRCRFVQERCRAEEPALAGVSPGGSPPGDPAHQWACWFPLGAGS